MEMMMKKRTTTPTVTSDSQPAADHAATVADLDQQIAATDAKIDTRRQQLATAHGNLDGEQAARDEAHATRDRLRLSALADDNEAAKSEYLCACVAYRTHVDLASEAALLIGQLEAELSRLGTERTALVQRRARAQIDLIAETVTVPAAAAFEAALDAVVAAGEQYRLGKQQQVQAAVQGDLDEQHSNKRWSLINLERRLRWQLSQFGIERGPGARSMSLHTLTDIEQGKIDLDDPAAATIHPATLDEADGGLSIAERIELALAQANTDDAEPTTTTTH
jgi:hypothetical protein